MMIFVFLFDWEVTSIQKFPFCFDFFLKAKNIIGGIHSCGFVNVTMPYKLYGITVSSMKLALVHFMSNMTHETENDAKGEN